MTGSKRGMMTWLICWGRQWMDNHEVCRRLRISPRTLQTLRDNGTLAFTKIGNRTYYRPDDVERVVGNVEDKRKEARWKGTTI